MARKDIHRPSALIVEDYDFIKFDYLPSGGDPLGDAMFLAEGRAYFRAHMEKHGGHYGENHSAGNCYICGARNIYSATFWHKPSNEYIQCGLECAGHLECGDAEAFKKKVKLGLEAQAGKRKAKKILDDAGLGAAWELYESEAQYRKAFAAESKAWSEANPDPEMVSSDNGYGMIAVGAPKYKQYSKEELIVLDIVGKVVKYGNVSEKQISFVRQLLDKIERAPEIEAEKAAKKAAEMADAKPVPVIEGRSLIRGEVLSIKQQESHFGIVTKMLVRAEAAGGGWFKAWGTIPAAIIDQVERGSVVEFSASLQRSNDDEFFGFWSRPSKAKIIKQEVAA